MLRDFIKILGAQCALKGVSSDLHILAPEDENFREDLLIPTLNDPDARKVVTIAAAHQYGAPWDSTSYGVKPMPNAEKAGLHIWQTEMGETNAGKGAAQPAGSDITNGLAYARMIHHCMTYGDASAWLYWWLWQNSDPKADGLIYATGGKLTFPKRYYVIGQFSRFIRPGWKRVEADKMPAPGIYTSAYVNPKDGSCALVLINQSKATKKIQLDAAGAVWKDAWRTSASEDLAEIKVDSVEAGGAVTLPAMSITTLLGVQ
jgi:glucuronoarabinoxylan endo-1,4-beta-xylanase